MLGFMVMMLKGRKIHPWHKLIFYVVDCIVEGIHKFIEVLFVKKYFMFLVREALIIFVETLFAFSDGYIKVICTGRFHIKKISALARLHFLGENFVPAIVFVLFHSSLGLVGYGLGLSKVVFNFFFTNGG